MRIVSHQKHEKYLPFCCSTCKEPSANNGMIGSSPIVLSRGLKYMIIHKGINRWLSFAWEMTPSPRSKKYLQQKNSRKVLVPQTTADFTSRVSKSYVPFTCKFPMVMHSVPILYRRCRSKTNFYVFSYDKISLKFCASFRFFLAVFMEKFPKIRYLSYVRRGISRLGYSL